LPKDIPVDVPDQLGIFLIERGDAVTFEVKERIDRPFVDAGKAELSSAAPAAQASTSETLSTSDSGAKKRGRPRKEALSSQTQPTE
jgi:stringent starvation protein B